MRRALMLLATGTVVTATAGAAQQPAQPARVPPGSVVQPRGPDNGAELRRHLTVLADNPRSLDALIGAGRAALQMGDAEAALSFFGRADELSPRNARVRAGMASALVQLGRAQTALQLFAEAVALGAPEVEIAGDRGLAFDMVGDPRRAQQDYGLALRRRDDAELRRRMALSLAISGQREAALRMIDVQLRRNDRAAWRTQAFVLALTGDAAGATRTAQGTMPAGAALAMAPFLARLAHLSPAQKAMAVHFGHFPSDGRAVAAARTDISADPGAVALAMGGTPPPPAARPRPAEPVDAAARRRPAPGPARPAPRRRADRTDSSDPYGLRGASPPVRRVPRPAPAPAPAEPPATEVAQLEPRWAPPSTPPTTAPVATTPQPSTVPPPSPAATSPSAPPASATTEPSPETRAAAPAPSAPPSEPPSEPSSEPIVPPGTANVMTTTRGPTAIIATPAEIGVADRPIVATSLPPSAPAAEPPAAVAPGFSLAQPAQAPPPAPAPQAAERAPLADIASIVNALPDEPRPAPPAEPRSRPAPARAVPPATAPARPRPAAPSHPSRHWVQIATVPDRAALSREYARLRGRAAEPLGRRAAYTAPYGRSSSRLLVGPFASPREAQEFVNRLAQAQVAAFAWTSSAGQEIERLPAGR